MRASLLVIAAVLGLAQLTVAADRDPRQNVRRPNLLFIVTDDQRWDALGVVQKEQGKNARFPWFATPNLDRLAGSPGGVRFRNAFVVHSLCSPSRASFLSGQYGHRNGLTNNSTHFSSSAVNQAKLLSENGYTTAYVGKFHMAFQTNRPGFTHVASYTSQGEYRGSRFLLNGSSTQPSGWVDDVATDLALDFMRERKTDPWMMMLGFKSPHTPRLPPERAKSRFAGMSVRPALNTDATPVYGRGQRAFRGEEIGKPVETDTDSQGSDDYLLNYFRCLSAIDDNVGRILDELEALRMADDTIVVFAGDNGYFLGEHGLGDKRAAYDESMRIPLLWRYPRLPHSPKVIDQMVLNLDLAPTFLDFAGIKAPPAMQGLSWKPLLTRSSRTWRSAFLFEYFFEPGLPATPAMMAVRTPTAKLISYPGHPDWTEVFDLKHDPYELKNLVHDPRHSKLRSGLENELARQISQYGHPFGSSK